MEFEAAESDVLALSALEQIKNLVFVEVLEWGQLILAAEALSDGHPEKLGANARALEQGMQVQLLSVAVGKRRRLKP